MSEPNTADSSDSRQESKSRVTTQETLLANLANAQAASESGEQAPQEQPGEAEQPKKKTAQERISELAKKRKDAEAKAEAAERRIAEMEEQLRAVQSRQVLEEAPKPKKEDFASDELYIEALTDWKAKEAIRQREIQERQERFKEEFEAIETAHNKRMEKAMKEIDDFKDVVEASTVKVPDALVAEIKDSRVGPELIYYLASHPKEAARIFAQRPGKALRDLLDLERDLMSEDKQETPVGKPKKPVPEPISPVRGASSPDPSRPTTFQEYKAKRMAEQKR
jgi:hypothetical protein